MDGMIIRNETAKDYQTVELITRDAFWNLYIPGCDEHYLVHTMRGHKDFISELDFVAELDGEIVGNVMYVKTKLIDANGNEKEILTFGPLTVRTDYQRRGVGKKLLEHSFKKAIEMGYDTIVIFGNPGNYVSRGFKSCKKFNVCVEGGVFPSAMLVKELIPSVFDGTRWYYHGSLAHEVDTKEAEEFDKGFAFKEKKTLPCQEEFYIHSNSIIGESSQV